MPAGVFFMPAGFSLGLLGGHPRALLAFVVMPAFRAGIHDLPLSQTEVVDGPGPSPAMTKRRHGHDEKAGAMTGKRRPSRITVRP